MKQKLRLFFMALLCAVCHGVWAQVVTYDFTGTDWTASDGALTNGAVTINGYGEVNFKMNNGYFMLGKNGAYITLPAYDFAVSKIEVEGRSGASGSVIMNVFVDDEAVSTQTTGVTGTNTYEIDAAYQAAGMQYTIKVLSAHNAQFCKIKVYKAQSSDEPYVIVSPTTITAGCEGVTDGSLSLTTNQINGLLFVYYEADGVTEAEDQVPSWFDPTFHSTDGTITYTIAENTGEERSLYFKVKGQDSKVFQNFVYSELITVTQEAYTDPTSIRWSEDFSYADAPSNYTFEPSASTTLYNQALAGGTAPELLIAKNNGSFVVEIDLAGYYGDMTLTFKANGDRVTVSADGGTVGTKTVENGVYTYPITVPEGTGTLILTFENNTSSNVRVDDFLLVGGTYSDAPIKTPANFSFGVETAEVTFGQTFDAPVLTYAEGFDGEITYASSDTSVAEIDQDGNVTIVGEGTTVISATSEGSETFGIGNASYTLTVNPSNDVVIVEDDKVTLKFDTDGWGIGTSKIVDENEFAASNDENFKITLCGTTGNGYRWYNTGYTLLGKEGAYLQLPAFDFAVSKIEVVGSSQASAAVLQNIYVGDVAVSTETTGAKDVTNEYLIDADYQAAGNIYKLVVTSNHNTQFTQIIVYKAEEPETFTLTISDLACDSENNYYATIGAIGEGNFIVPADAEVSTIIINNGSMETTQSFAAGEVFDGTDAYLVTATRSGDFEFVATTADAGINGDNMLYPATAGVEITAPELGQTYRYYKLSLNKNSAAGSVGFYYGAAGGAPFTFTTANKAYLAVPQGNTGETQTTDVIPFDDKTGIDAVTTETKAAEGVFTLTGVRLDGNKLQKGVYIVNGKKQIVK